jgi:hypothetical protein
VSDSTIDDKGDDGVEIVKVCLVCETTFVTSIPEEDVCEQCQATYDLGFDR